MVVHILKVFSSSRSPTILVFHNGVPKARGYEKSRFSTNIGLYLELMQDRAIVTMEGKYETASKLSNGASLNDLE